MKGYVVVFEGDDESGYSAYSPDLPGVMGSALRSRFVSQSSASGACASGFAGHSVRP
jgi:hypothetical protein